MSDLIRRSDAIEAIEAVDWYHQNSRNKDMVNGANSDEHQAWYKADDVYKALKEVPSADRPQGEWMHRNSYWHTAICSNCKKVTMFEEWDEEVIEYDFCPNCGARMKGADNEDN